MADRAFGPYQLVRQVAVGGMAEIHLAKTRGIAGFEKYVALKMIHPNFALDDQFIEMLIDEAKIAVQLQHVNIAQTFDLGRVGDTYYITLEFVDGADLYKILRRGSEQDLDMPLDVCAFIAKEMATGLDYAHRKRDVTGKPLGIVHRDVSPQNVLVSHAGEVKLVDFGIARATLKARQTAIGVIKGKYYYMSPEQAWGDRVDHRSDVFSAGICLYEMLTGQMLYLEEDLHKLLDMVRRAAIAPPSKLRKGIPPQLERIVMHALAKKPDDRYQSAGDMAADLERFLHTYSPVFTASKLSQHLRAALGEQVAPPPQPVGAPTPRDPRMSTQPIDQRELVRERSEIRDENSVIFRIGELAKPVRTSTGNVPIEDQTDPGDQTMISAPPAGFMDVPHGTADAEYEATMIDAPPSLGADDEAPTPMAPRPLVPPGGGAPAKPLSTGPRAMGEPTVRIEGRPEALLAHTPSPAVSEIRPPRLSRKTPTDLRPVSGQSVLQSIVDSAAPPPRPASLGVTKAGPVPPPPPTPPPRPGSAPPPAVPGAPPNAVTMMAEGNVEDSTLRRVTAAVGGPQASPTPANQLPSPAAMISPTMTSPIPYHPGFSTSQRLAALEVDEIPAHLKIRPNPRGWLVRGLIIGLVATSVATVSVLMWSGREDPPTASLLIDSVPPGASVTVDGTELLVKTPAAFPGTRPSARHELRVALPGFQAWSQSVVVPARGGEHRVTAFLRAATVKLTVRSTPPGADVLVNGDTKGTTPLLLDNLDPESAKTIELRLKGFRPEVKQLDWSSQREIELDVRLRP